MWLTYTGALDGDVLCSGMSGFMQTAFYFGYNAVVCFGFFLMLGMVGWRASLLFVRRVSYKHMTGWCHAL